MSDLMSLSCDVPVGDLRGILSNLELAQVSLRNLRDRLVDSTDKECEDASIIISLYLSYTDQLISKASREVYGERDHNHVSSLARLLPSGTPCEKGRKYRKD